MQTYTKPQRVHYSEQIALFITPQEKVSLEQIASQIKGTKSQVLRLALFRFAQEFFSDNDQNEKDNTN